MKLYVRLFGLSVVALLLFNDPRPNLVVSAQQKQPGKAACPVTKVTCPEIVYTTDKLRFTAEVQGGDSKVTQTYNWTVSAGSIEFGQGTPSISVSTRNLSDGETVTATVEVGGYDRECGYGQVASSWTSSRLSSNRTQQRRVVSSRTAGARAEPETRRRQQTKRRTISSTSVALIPAE